MGWWSPEPGEEVDERGRGEAKGEKRQGGKKVGREEKGRERGRKGGEKASQVPTSLFSSGDKPRDRKQ